MRLGGNAAPVGERRAAGPSRHRWERSRGLTTPAAAQSRPSIPLALRGPSARAMCAAARSATPSVPRANPAVRSLPGTVGPARLRVGARGRENHIHDGGNEMTEIHLPDQMRRDITTMRIVERRTLRQIGAAYGHSWEWAKRRCRALGLPARIEREPTPRRQHHPVDDILALRARGLTTVAIARALGLTKNQVIGRLWRAGLCQPREENPSMLEFVALVERIPATGCRYIAAPEPRLHEGMYCGKPCLVGERAGQPVRLPYCAEHHALCHLPSPAPKARDARIA